MATVKPNTQKIDLAKALKGSDQVQFTEDLTKEFATARITHLEHVKNAPLKIKITYGADIYKIMKIITEYYERPKKVTEEIKKSSKVGERS